MVSLTSGTVLGREAAAEMREAFLVRRTKPEACSTPLTHMSTFAMMEITIFMIVYYYIIYITFIRLLTVITIIHLSNATCCIVISVVMSVSVTMHGADVITTVMTTTAVVIVCIDIAITITVKY